MIRPHALFPLFLSLALFGCASQEVAGTSPVHLRPTNSWLPGKFVWFDLLTNDVDAACTFYGQLFGWWFQPSAKDPEYQLVIHNDVAIAGVALHPEPGEAVQESVWLASLSVEDVDRAVQLTLDRGGELVAGPVDDPARGRLAIVVDPEGAPLVLLRALGGDPLDAAPSERGWVWMELLTRDPQAAAAYYQLLVGWEQRALAGGSGETFQLFVRSGHARASWVELPWNEVDPSWLAYVGVADVAATVARARELGGRLLLEAGDVAVIEDPAGGVLGLQQWRGGERAEVSQ